MTDLGTYECTLKKKSAVCDLTTKYQTLTLGPETTVHYLPGTKVMIPCVCSGGIQTSMDIQHQKWTRDGKVVIGVSGTQDPMYQGRTGMTNKRPYGNFTIFLKETTVKDAGDYICDVYDTNDHCVKRKTTVRLVAIVVTTTAPITTVIPGVVSGNSQFALSFIGLVLSSYYHLLI